MLETMGSKDHQTPDKYTKWQQVNNSKKRGRNSPEFQVRESKQFKITDCWLNNPTTTKNKFDALTKVKDITSPSSDDREAENKQIAQNHLQKSPPIFVSGVSVIKPLIDLLNEIAKDNYNIKVLPNNEVKIQPSSSEKFIPIVEALKKKNTEFHTFQRKQDRSFKVVLRNMHPSTDAAEIQEEIEKLGHKVRNITNIKHNTMKVPLPLFFIELESNDQNKTIYKVNRLLNTVVIFEPLRKKRDIPQCSNCQGYNHTKNYCYKQPVCVKCARNHATNECPIKEKIKEVKCANCEGNHPASYKGCEVRKQLHQKFFQTLRPKEINQTSSHTKITGDISTVRPNVTFAQAVKERNNISDSSKQTIEDKQTTTDVTNVNINSNKIEEMMIHLMNRMDTMLNLLSTLLNKLGN